MTGFMAPTVGVKGEYRVVVSRDPGMEEVVHDSGVFPNLITDIGMNRLGSHTHAVQPVATLFQGCFGVFRVGSGTSAPQFTDSSLDNEVASSGSLSSTTNSANYARGDYTLTVSAQFGQGVAAGNISEIGLGPNNTTLCSRALILDAEGDPTTITVTESDFLTVFYTFKRLIPQDDLVYNIIVDYDEDGLVPTEVTVRPINADNNSAAQWGFSAMMQGSNWRNISGYTGGLALPTATDPTGLVGATSEARTSYDPYVYGSYERWLNAKADINELNSSTLRNITVGCMHGRFQFVFDPPLVKDNTQEMDFRFGQKWARA